MIWTIYFAECNCSPNGRTSESCDSSGQCTCNQGSEGVKCDQCQEGFIGEKCDKIGMDYFYYLSQTVYTFQGCS